MTRAILMFLAAGATTACAFSIAPASGHAHPATTTAPTHKVASPAPITGKPAAVRSGVHDFDFIAGAWHTHIRSLQRPLSGSTSWVGYEGTVVEQKIYDGAFLEHLKASGPTGHFEGLTLFLYDPQAHQWIQTFASRSNGTLEAPAIGEFHHGRGELVSQQNFQGRVILVRDLWSDIKPDSHRFEQAYSDDHGKTWEPNFVAMLTRIRQ